MKVCVKSVSIKLQNTLHNLTGPKHTSDKQMYTLITFGSNQQLAQSWWNSRTKHDTQRSAERAGLDCMPIAGTFGYVVVKEFGETSWIVVDDMMPPNASVWFENGEFHVQPAPQLQLV